MMDETRKKEGEGKEEGKEKEKKITRLSDIPDDILQAIERAVTSEEAKKYPVTSEYGATTLGDFVQKRFGYRLSPQQLYELKRGYKTVKVKLPEPVKNQLEREYGDLTNAIKAFSQEALSHQPPPPDLELAVKTLGGMRTDYNEAVRLLLNAGYPNANAVITRMFREGYAHREGNDYVFTTFRVSPTTEIIRALFGSGMPIRSKKWGGTNGS